MSVFSRARGSSRQDCYNKQHWRCYGCTPTIDGNINNIVKTQDQERSGNNCRSHFGDGGKKSSAVSLSLSTNLVLVPQSLFWFTPPFQSLRDTQQCPSLPLRRSRRSRSQTSGLRRSVPHTPRTRGSPSGLLAEDRLSGRRRSGPCRGPDPQGGPFLWPSSSFRETKTNPTRCISGLPVRTAETARGGAKGGQCRHISYIWIYIYMAVPWSVWEQIPVTKRRGVRVWRGCDTAGDTRPKRKGRIRRP